MILEVARYRKKAKCGNFFSYSVKELHLNAHERSLAPWVFMFPNLEHLKITHFNYFYLRRRGEIDLRDISLVSLDFYSSCNWYLVLAVYLYKTHCVEKRYFSIKLDLTQLIEITEAKYHSDVERLYPSVTLRFKSLDKISISTEEFGTNVLSLS